MKKIIIEISDSQHEEMKTFLEKCFSIKLDVSPLGEELSVEMYGKVELGDVKWRIE